MDSKYRRKSIYKELRLYLGDIFKDLATSKECTIEEGHLMSDHVHLLISIPPKYSDAQIVGFIKGKSAISIARTYFGRRKNFTGQRFWARGYYVTTVGRRDEEIVRNYIKHQDEDHRIEQLNLFKRIPPLGGAFCSSKQKGNKLEKKSCYEFNKIHSKVEVY